MRRSTIASIVSPRRGIWKKTFDTLAAKSRDSLYWIDKVQQRSAVDANRQLRVMNPSCYTSGPYSLPIGCHGPRLRATQVKRAFPHRLNCDLSEFRRSSMRQLGGPQSRAMTDEGYESQLTTAGIITHKIRAGERMRPSGCDRSTSHLAFDLRHHAPFPHAGVRSLGQNHCVERL